MGTCTEGLRPGLSCAVLWKTLWKVSVRFHMEFTSPHALHNVFSCTWGHVRAVSSAPFAASPAQLLRRVSLMFAYNSPVGPGMLRIVCSGLWTESSAKVLR